MAPTPATPSEPAQNQAAPGPSGTVGATPGTYGLIDPAALVSRAPISISGNSQWTSANGVRYGAGTAGNPYVIENWSIDQCSINAYFGIHITGNTTVHAIIRNVKIYNMNSCSQADIGILVGPSAPPYSMNYAENVTVTRSEIHIGGGAMNQYAIDISFDSKNNAATFNAIFLNATTQDWEYGILAQSGAENALIRGNYIDARNAQATATLHTVGVQIGDSCAPFVGYPSYVTCPSGMVVDHNTVMNATSSGIVSDGTRFADVHNNLVFQSYPGRKCVGTCRGIQVESRSNYTKVHENIFQNYQHGIEAAAWGGWYWNNSLLNNDYGVYTNDNGSFANAQFTDFNVFWNNEYSGNTNRYSLAANEYTTNFDITGTPTTTSFPISFTNQANRVVTSIEYSWSLTSLNVSYGLPAQGYMAAVTIYDHVTSAQSETLHAQWSGIGIGVSSVTNFVPANVSFHLTSTSGSVVFAGSGFVPAGSYNLERNSVVTQAISTSPAGVFPVTTIAGPYGADYEILYTGDSPPGPSSETPPAVTTGAATSVASASATVSANITSLGSAPSVTVGFLYGTNASLSGSANATVGSQASVGAFSENLTGLTPGATYYFEAWAAGQGFAVGGILNVTLPSTSQPPPSPAALRVLGVTYNPDAETLDVIFSQDVIRASVEAAVSLTPATRHQFLWLSGNHLEIGLAASLNSSQEYTLTIGPSATALDGQTLADAFTFRFTVPSAALAATPNPTPFSEWWPWVTLGLAAGWVGALIAYGRSRGKLRAMRRMARMLASRIEELRALDGRTALGTRARPVVRLASAGRSTQLIPRGHA